MEKQKWRMVRRKTHNGRSQKVNFVAIVLAFVVVCGCRKMMPSDKQNDTNNIKNISKIENKKDDEIKIEKDIVKEVQIDGIRIHLGEKYDDVIAALVLIRITPRLCKR